MRRVIYGLMAAMIAAVPIVGSGLSAGAVDAWAPVYTAQVHLAGTDIVARNGQFVSKLPVLDAAAVPGWSHSIQTIDPTTPSSEIDMEEFKANMLAEGVVPDYTGTWVWGYVTPGTVTDSNRDTPRDTYTGPVVIAQRGTPSEFKYVNNLGSAATTNVLAYKYSIDQSLHWANPKGVDKYVPTPFASGPAYLGNPDHYADMVPAAVHLHGAEDPAAIDGGPDSWFTNYVDSSNTTSALHGQAFYSRDGNHGQNYSIYRYPNVQEAAPLWFHDHTLGATRLNVYAGLAGAYDLIDLNLKLPAGLAPLGLDRNAAKHPTDTPHAYAADELVIPLVVQDRMFDTDGQLFYNNSPLATNPDPQNVAINPDHAYWTPEFFGDTIAVNGKVWPYLEVAPQRYEFYMINGSNARSYILSFQKTVSAAPGYTGHDNGTNPPTIWQIATDQGYLDAPVKADPLVIMPGERAVFIIDFSGSKGNNDLVLNNFGPDVPLNSLPVDVGDRTPDNPTTTGLVMQFRVSNAAVTDNSFNPAGKNPTIRKDSDKIIRLVDPATASPAKNVKVDLTRALTLVEIANDNPTTIIASNGDNLSFSGGPLEVLVNNTKWTGIRRDPMDPNPNNMMGDPVNGGVSDGIGNYLTERPNEGATEIWEIINTTMDAHPIHTHLAQFQLMNRQAVTMGDMGMPGPGTYAAAYSAAFPDGMFVPGYGSPLAYGPSAASGGKYGGNPDVTPFLLGVPTPPNPNEAGWKDTVMCPPGMVTRFVIRWAPTDMSVQSNSSPILRYAFTPNDEIPGKPGAIFDYVWHCHIVDHEDNEMMRPDAVVPKPYAYRSYVMGRDY